MDELAHTQAKHNMLKNAAQSEQEVTDAGPSGSGAQERVADEEPREPETGRRRRRKKTYSHAHFKVYKRRWFGLAQLVLLNVVVSWDWLTFAPVSTRSAAYFGVSETAINWLSTAFMFAFVPACPFVVYLLHRSPKESILCASVLLLIGNWIRYAGTRANTFGVVMFGQILTGLSQPFVLAAPTRYSDMWFTERGRVGATALASLANPFGGALAQLVNPFFGSIPQTVLIISIIATVACIPSLFIPASPPTPPTASSSLSRTPLLVSLNHMLRSPPFYILLLTFSIYVGFFNAFSSLLNQILYPYAFSEDEAGICGAILIVVGLVVAAITSPVLDRTHAYLRGIKLLCPLIAVAYLAMVWAPQTRSIVAPYIIAALLGAASFSLLPVALEYLVEITYPASPEVSSTMCWAGGQTLGAVFVVVMNALKDGRPVDLEQVQSIGSEGERPPGNMFNALVFQAVVALAVLPLPLMLGIKRLGLAGGEGRLRVDEHREGSVGGESEGGVGHEQ
ncbi:MFS general substrate transporter [Dothidotthia symphoricarpi CBS 119687]|uniref:MFS general substrate transporter n=1 Tax=Dothidotthia symphoricarpi CBS 119687 TaxID=1392245 RepID=A0A6A6AEN4_9PLEO|nr:MFS general substrate transporter [Dothidotthia symphoricarpi CBS 119687]KAF2130349.1 MFS general substrate transporter [Dothidotthia symphoricarpi CBS 119687]